ncbi:hypothetical protein [Nocardia sp. NPDC056100]
MTDGDDYDVAFVPTGRAELVNQLGAAAGQRVRTIGEFGAERPH